MSMIFKYFPAEDCGENGGFIGTDDGKFQLCDFRAGCGVIWGPLIAGWINDFIRQGVTAEIMIEQYDAMIQAINKPPDATPG